MEKTKEALSINDEIKQNLERALQDPKASDRIKAVLLYAYARQIASSKNRYRPIATAYIDLYIKGDWGEIQDFQQFYEEMESYDIYYPKIT